MEFSTEGAEANTGLICAVVCQAVRKFYEQLFNPYGSESDNEQENLIEILIRRAENRIKKQKRVPHRIQGYFEQTIPQFTDKEFQQHFRVTRQVFDILLGNINEDLRNTSTTGRPTIEPAKQLLYTLWLLATPDSYRSVADRFNMGKASLYFSFQRVIGALNKISSAIVWPNIEEKNHSIQEFHKMAGLQKVIGAVDGTYIPIKAPQENPEVYINRKCFHAITLQAICDSKCRFIDCFVGYPSSVSDNRIFKNSDIFKSVMQDKQSFFEPGEFIVGDKAYPLLEWCITPFIDRGNLTNNQKNFNTRHAKTRQVIERSFALLFGRLRRLRYLDMARIDLMPATIIACCVIHNICKSDPEDLQELFENEGRPYIHGADDQLVHENYGNSTVIGFQIRQNIARNV